MYLMDSSISFPRKEKYIWSSLLEEKYLHSCKMYVEYQSILQIFYMA